MKIKLNKILSLFTAAIILFSCITVFSEEKTEKHNPKEYNILVELGLAEDGLADATASRGEFVKIIYNILTYPNKAEGSSWQENFYGNHTADFNLIEYVQTSKAVFNDVDSGNPYYEYVLCCLNGGIINGEANGNFYPERTITGKEALKILMDLTGYGKYAEFKGGYLRGYLSAASDVTAMASISSLLNKELAFSEAAKMIYTFLTVPMFDISAIKNDNITYKVSDKTVLSEYMELDFVKGVMTDNGLTSIYGGSKVDSTQIIVDGKKLDVSDKLSYLSSLREYLGYNVTAYYSINEDTKDDLVCLVPEENNLIEIDAADIDSVSDKTIKYSDGKTVKASAGAYVILNNEYVSNYTDKTFNIKNGKIRIFSLDKKNDLFVMESYETVYISALDFSDKVIYNELGTLAGGNSLINYKSYEENSAIDVFDSKGELKDVTALKENTVVI